MYFCRRNNFMVVVSFLIVLSFEAYLWLMQTPLLPQTIQSTDLCKGEIANDTITALKYNKTFIISPYHDDREGNLTRVIAVVRYKKIQDLYCWFCCSHDGHVSIIRAAIDIHLDRTDFPFGPADIVCLEPKKCSPKYVSIHSSPRGKIDKLPRFEIKNRVPKDSFSAEFTLCLPVMFGNYSNVLQFIQSMEMYKILGAQKVLVYMYNCSQLIEKVLEFYVAEGTIDIIQWPIFSYVNFSSFWYSSKDWDYGKATVLNDCIYRNMYRSKYVVLNDIDEIILPIKHLSWKTMISDLEDRNPETGIFLFENHLFPQHIFSSTDTLNISSWKMVPGTNILQHIYREPIKLKFSNQRKMIVNPRAVVQTSVHTILKGYSKTLVVPKEIAILYHCRQYVEKEVPGKYLIRDTTIWRYNVSLINNVNNILEKQFPRKSSKFRWNKF
ncbi:beta-1,4-galactosyltransferase galt-1-like isoform X1 [Podarcis raffonei]|uniref:beta-1,4-galactosyltransferase galt-1-like isoform X1 n=1 Tax=Podarcis raffonei TaxID=65483 RepID=UPI0023298B6E|nr:beta-1,4-galactosyltransferase galt-1-like isoform X1 [Podarcis raffonei]XP_053230235.1 beta-1,4-galactosyltransferase galt-1-like isoform X1 [Podarcis raffonei]XP_053230236.1 beta-1,4-galactosyltransferase galt-1-like isoform X1 [Podarcis raffonei]XP_053230237.1 beta-1,4-galactosyltransferase galt-1-like isoform X1 [Podarcis raffonei]XP_053230238.1 beta-1,4-galactosyltransferase galt-1-like isoform X1 [Podarcis raffonei]